MSPEPPGPSPTGNTATNAAAIMRGALLFGLPLAEKVSVVKTWAPFNNTDVNITTDDSWNYAIVADKPMTFVWTGDTPKCAPSATSVSHQSLHAAICNPWATRGLSGL